MSYTTGRFYDKRPRHLAPTTPSDILAIFDLAANQRRASVLGETKTGPLFGQIEESVVVLGGTRMGKSSAFFTPSVATFPGPVVVTSTRSDLRDNTLALRQRIVAERGGEIYELDPLGMLKVQSPRLYFDPVKGCESWTVAVQRALLLTELTVVDRSQTHWKARAAKLTAALLHAAALEGDSVEGVIEAIDLQGETLERYAQTLSNAADIAVLNFGEAFESQPTHPVLGTRYSGSGHVALESVLGAHGAATEERKSIVSTASSIFDAYGMRDDNGASVLGRWNTSLPTWADSFDLARFLSTPSTIYITVPEGAERELKPIVAAFVDSVVRGWKELSAYERAPGLFLALDEAANTCPLPQLPRLMTTGGGDHIHVAVGLQEPSQVVQHWGEAGKQIYASANHLVVFPGIGDAEFLKRLCDAHPIVSRHGFVVRARNEHGTELQTASVERLVVEREALEAARRGAADGLPQDKRVAAALHAVYQARVRDGVVIRQRYLQSAGGVGALFAELSDMTYVEEQTSRRPEFEPADIANPPEGSVYRRSGSVGERTHLRPFFASRFWHGVFAATPVKNATRRVSLDG